MNTEQVRDLLRDACDKAGGQKSFSEEKGMSQQYINDVLKGRRAPGAKCGPEAKLYEPTLFRKLILRVFG